MADDMSSHYQVMEELGSKSKVSGFCIFPG